MAASNFSDAQKAVVIKQCEDSTPVAEICRRAGISPATCSNWKTKDAGPLPTEMKRLKQLEHENRRWKKIVADLPLDREMLRARPQSKRSGERSEAPLSRMPACAVGQRGDGLRA